MLKELIDYTKVADEKIISTFLSTSKNLPEAEALFSHVLNAQHIWINRIKGTLPRFERFEIHSKSYYMPLHIENFEGIYALLDTDLETIIKYTISTGDSFEDKSSDILFHLINHSTYHRAQIATQFRINEIEPPITDFIILKRQK